MATEDSRKLFMAGLPDSVTEEVLRTLLTETGAQVTELTVPRDRATGRPRGFAFVRLGSDAEAERARQDLDGRIVDGKMISVRPFHADPPAGREARGPREGGGGYDRGPREGGGGGYDRGPRDGGGPGGGPGGGGGGGYDRPPMGDRPPRSFDGPRGGGPGGGRGPEAQDRTLYVGNLPYDASQEEIDALFNNAGAETPARVYLPVDPDGRKRGFGFVTMGSSEAANAALQALAGADLRGRRLIINIAHPKGERPAGGGGDRPMGDRPPRPFGGGFSGGPPGGGFSGGPPGGGGPGGPPARSGKGEGRKRRFEDGPSGARGGGGRTKDDGDDWKDRDWDE